MKKTFIYLCISLLPAFVSCNNNEKKSGDKPVEIDEAKVAAFQELSSYGFYNSNLEGSYLFDEDCQEMIYNPESGVFIIQNEALEHLVEASVSATEFVDFYSVTVSGTPESIPSGIFDMKMVKKENDKAWLWEKSNNFGIVILYALP